MADKDALDRKSISAILKSWLGGSEHARVMLRAAPHTLINTKTEVP